MPLPATAQVPGPGKCGNWNDAPTGNTTTGKPRPAAAATVDQVPEPHERQTPEPDHAREGGELTKATNDDAEPKHASDRDTNRARSGTEALPPDHQLTEAPET